MYKHLFLIMFAMVFAVQAECRAVENHTADSLVEDWDIVRKLFKYSLNAQLCSGFGGYEQAYQFASDGLKYYASLDHNERYLCWYADCLTSMAECSILSDNDEIHNTEYGKACIDSAIVALRNVKFDEVFDRTSADYLYERLINLALRNGWTDEAATCAEISISSVDTLSITDDDQMALVNYVTVVNAAGDCAQANRYSKYLLHMLVDDKTDRIRNNDSIVYLTRTSLRYPVDNSIFESAFSAPLGDSYQMMDYLMFCKNLYSRARHYSFDSLVPPCSRLVQKQLRQNEVLIEFAQYRTAGGKVGYGAFVMRSTGAPVAVKITDDAANDNLELTFTGFWKPLEQYLDRYDTVFFVSDGWFSNNNPEFYYVDKSESAIQRYNIFRLSSSLVLLDERQQNHLKPKRAVLYGGITYSASPGDKERAAGRYRDGVDPLPYSLKEVKSVCKKLRKKGCRVEMFTETSANEESFVNMDKHIDILHIATHGFLEDASNAENPFGQSGLLLAGSNTESSWAMDGKLTGEEIIHCDLSGVKLVVLSACESGYSENCYGNMFGLIQAFKLAGAQTILASVYPVEDKVMTDFISFFYDVYAKNGYDVYDAFQVARYALMYKYPDDLSYHGLLLIDAPLRK